MKRYTLFYDSLCVEEHLCEMEPDIDGEWVKADIAEEMYEALEWLLNLRSGRAKGGDDFSAEAQWDDAWDSAIKAIEKARGE